MVLDRGIEFFENLGEKMKQAKTLILALMLVCLSAGNAFAKDPFFSPRFYISPFMGLSYEKPSSDHNFHWSTFQVGVTLFQTERLIFGKLAFAMLAGDDHNEKDCPPRMCGADAHPSLVFSPVLIKMLRDGGPGTGERSTALTFDIGVDHEKRLVTALGIAF